MSNATIQSEQQTTNIAENAVFLSLTIRMPGNRKKVDSSRVEVDADRKMVSVSKKLLMSPEFDAITSLSGEVRRYLGSKCLPADFVKSGIYLCPLGLIERVNDRLDEYGLEFSARVDTFISAYEHRKCEAIHRLNGLWRESDYPPVDVLRQQFAFGTKLMVIGVPNSLSEIRADIFAEERSKAEAEWRAASEEIRLLLRESFRDLVSHMSERLEPSPDGKRKIFRDSMVSNLSDFLSDFDFRNLTNDDELASMVQQVRGLLDGVSPGRLRRGGSWYRDEVRSNMTDIKQQLDSMLSDAAERQITLD